MTTDDEQSLARRLVACKHFRLKPGMWDSELWLRCVAVYDDGSSLWAGDETMRRMRAGGDVTPDLADPATLGCLLALVCEAWGDDTITTTCGPSHDDTPMIRVQQWAGTAMRNLLTFMYRSRAEALVAALEAAT